MAKHVLSLGGAAFVLGMVAVACGTDSLGIDLQLDGGPTGDDAGKDTDAGVDANPTPRAFAIGGTITGLTGTGLVLQNNGGDDVTVNANSTFVFKTKIEAGKTFDVTVKNQPTAPSQQCTVTGGKGTAVNGNVTTVVVNCSTNSFTVGGTVSGLAGTGLVLTNNGGNDATIGADGQFAFTSPVTDGTGYAVAVKTQPSNLSQTCTVTSGSGNVASANVTSVSVVCVTDKFSVGGTVTGLSGTGLVLKNKNGDDLPIGANGTFKFAMSHDDGSSFDVTVGTSPTGPQQSCSVTGGTGTIAGGDVSSITVNCDKDKFVVGGTVTGLEGSGLVIQNNGGDDRAVSSDGTFAFATTLADLDPYSVTVKTHPTNKWQTCTIANASGNVAAAAVDNIAITCTTNTYKVKGTVSGLDGSGLVIQNNAGDDLAISANGKFELPSQVASGSGYLVTTLTHPSGKSQTCAVANGSGTIAGVDVDDVAITCTTNHYSVGGNLTGLAAGNDVVLQNNAGDNLTVNGDGPFTFNASLESGQAFAVSVLTQPSTPSQTCVVTGESGTVTAGNIVSVSVNCSTNQYTVGGTVSGLDGTGLVLQNNGADLPINANGGFSLPAQTDGTTYDVTVKTQPSAKTQTCVVTNGSGTLAGANVTNLAIACTTSTFAVGGSVTGLGAGESVVVTNNGGNDRTVSADGSFTFATPIASGSLYGVAVKTQPANKGCTVTNGTGSVTSGPVSNVVVTCIPRECKSVNGLLWCRDASPARSCNTLCSAIGLGTPTITNNDWFAAQDTVAECNAIAAPFGLAAGSMLPYTYACAEEVVGQLLCSIDTSCPQNHRTGSDTGGHRAVCPCTTSRVCNTAAEGLSNTITCPAGTAIRSITYASYGTPDGTCGAFTNGWCHASTSQTVVEGLCLGKATCTVPANNQTFTDPCGGTHKRLYIQASCE